MKDPVICNEPLLEKIGFEVALMLLRESVAHGDSSISNSSSGNFNTMFHDSEEHTWIFTWLLC